MQISPNWRDYKSLFLPSNTIKNIQTLSWPVINFIVDVFPKLSTCFVNRCWPMNPYFSKDTQIWLNPYSTCNYCSVNSSSYFQNWRSHYIADRRWPTNPCFSKDTEIRSSTITKYLNLNFCKSIGQPLCFYKKYRDEGLPVEKAIAKYLKTFCTLSESIARASLEFAHRKAFHLIADSIRSSGWDRGIDRAMSAGPISIGNRVWMKSVRGQIDR